jgi:hypothetical protein
MTGKLGCPHCNGTGRIAGSFGIETVCKCVIDQLNEQDAVNQPASTITAPTFEASMNVHLQKAIHNKILTKADLDLEYSREYALKSLAERCEALHLKISKQAVTDCLDTMDGILAGLRLGQLPNKSYAIGIENGIGKTTFAITAMRIAVTHELSIVPLVDMSTLAEKYLEYSNKMRMSYERAKRGIIEEEDKPYGVFDWRDYVESDLCIVSLTGGNANIAYVELDTLMTLLARRSDNRKPTIVLMRTPIEYYTKFDDVRKYLIKEIFAMNNKTGTYRMLERHSMFTREPTE